MCFDLNTDTKTGTAALPFYWLTEFLFAKAKCLSVPNQEYSLKSCSDTVPLPLPGWGQQVSHLFLGLVVVILPSHRRLWNFFGSAVLILFSRFFYIRWLVSVLCGFVHLIFASDLASNFFFFKVDEQGCSSRRTTGCGESRIHISVWARSRDYKQTLVVLRNLGDGLCEGLLGMEGDSRRGRWKKMENFTLTV